MLVIADPEGQKLGVGGSTLHVLTELLKSHGHDLYAKKILIIHSGKPHLWHIYFHKCCCYGTLLCGCLLDYCTVGPRDT